LAAMFLVVLLGAGCAKRINPRPPTGEISDVGALLKLTDEAENKIRSIKGEAGSRVNSPRSKGAINLFVAAARPTFVHLEFLNFFGKPQAILVSDDQSFGLFNSDEGKYYCGPPSPINLSRVLPAPLPVQDLVSLMLGQAPRIRAESRALSVDPETGAYLVVLDSGAVTQRLWIEPSSYRVLKSEIKGLNAYQVAFEDFDLAGGVIYPKKITFDAPNPPTHFELRYRDTEINGNLDRGMFKFEPPQGVPVVELDQDGQEVHSSSRINACAR
jgi:outer membrane lipoprotein-sorting protein